MKTYALSASVLFLAIALLASVYFYNAQQASGSVIFGAEYQMATVTTGTSTLKTLAGTLGSVVIPNAGSAGTIYFYATTSQATSSADQILAIDGAAAENTYTFDVGFGHGLLVESRGFNGTAVITYR